MAEQGELIRLEGVGKIFPTPSGPRQVLDEVSLSIARGSIYGLIGRSGAGKSTLLRLLNRLESPSTGRVLLGGQDLAALSPAELLSLRRRVGMVFQHFNLISAKTVAQNVALPLIAAGTPKPEIAVRLAQVLARVGLTKREQAYPAELSGGEKQRVGIARALISRPEVLLCDEATSALDPETTRAILVLLKELSGELSLTILMITHEMAVLKAICDRAAVLETGRIVEEGPVWQIVGAPKSSAAQALLIEDDALLPQVLTKSLVPRNTPGSRTLIRLRFDGTKSADLPEGRWLAGKLDRIQGRDVGQVILALPEGAPLPLDAEVLGHVAADV